MKTVLLTVVMLCSICLVAYAQTVNLRLKDQSVEQAIEQLKKTSGYSFVFASGDIDTKKVVSVNASNATMDNVIGQILAGQEVTWQISGQNIVIKKGASGAAKANARPILYTGTVRDAQGQPVIGAAIFVRGTKIQAMTDANGTFSLTATPGAILSVAYFGYVPTEVALIASNPTLNITLQEDALTIADVVVVGYGTQKRINLTGAVSTVDKEYLQTRPVNNVVQAMQGTVPGLNISASTQGGRLNQGMNINIRGGGTIGEGSNSAPLVMIDGVPGDLTMLNPDDVADISVLKDAGSAAIYGSRAAFGVILVTTKKGKAGKAAITYTNNFRFAAPIRMPSQADSYSFATYLNDTKRNSGQADFFTSDVIEMIQQFQRGEITESNRINPSNKNMWARNNMSYNNVDWYQEHIKPWTFAQEHNLSMSGGSEAVQYYISLNYLGQEGMLRYGEDQNQRYSFMTKVDAKLTKWLKLSSNIKFTRTDTDEPTFLADDRFSGLFFQGMSRVFPTVPVTNPDGSYSWPNFIDRVVNGGRVKQQNDLLYLQLAATANLTKHWTLNADINYRVRNENRRGTVLSVSDQNVDGTRMPQSMNGVMPAGYTEINERAYKDNYISSNIYTDYTRSFESGHYFKVMVGFNFELDQYRNLALYRPDLINPDLPTINTATGADKITDGSYNHWSTAGFFGRVNYNYKERYLFQFNMRYDGSSRFKQDLRWNWFPSVELGWNIAKEAFMEPVGEQINLLKIRASYGTLGNQNTSNLYPYYQTVPYTAGGGNWLINGLKPNVAGIPSLISNYLTWERVESWNVGLDFSFLANRLTGSFDYFQRNTLDMVGPAPQLPNTLGTTVPPMNNADLQTNGWELALAWNDKVGDWNYGIRATVSDYTTKVTRYPNKTNSIDTYAAGQPLGQIWGYTTVGIAKDQAQMDTHLASVNQGSLGSNWAAGDVMYADLDGDGKISSGKRVYGDTGDLSVLGNSTPRYQYGLTLNLGWKGIDFLAFFQGVAQRDLWLGDTGSTIYWGATSGGEWQTAVFDEHLDYFRTADSPLGENLNAKFPRPLYGTDKNRQTQSGYMENGAYFRLKTLQLGYTFPAELTRKAAIERLRVYVSGENLWTVTSLPKSFDPETYSGIMGVGRVYPLQAIISFGISIGF